MKRSRRKALMDKGWLLPENPFPTDTVCVQFEIPRDLQYVAVINGLLADLGKWWNWEKGGEGDRRATDVAAMFRKMIYETLCIEDYHEMGCNCNDPQTYLHRLTADGTLERSTDGGITWEIDPTDPRLTALDLPPLAGTDGDEKRCQAAYNIRTHFEERADNLVADASLWAGINGMLAAIITILLFAGIIGTGGALTPIALSLGAALLSAGQTAFNAAMTSEVFDTFQCILYCEMQEDGTLTDAGIAAVKANISHDLTGIAVTFFEKNLTLLGLIGVNNMAATASNGTANCSSCPACDPCDYVCTVTFGTLVEQDGCRWRIASSPVSGTNAINLRIDSGNGGEYPSACGYFKVTLVSGSDFTNSSYNECGTEISNISAGGLRNFAAVASSAGSFVADVEIQSFPWP